MTVAPKQPVLPHPLDVLNSRSKELSPLLYSYKLGPGNSYGLDVAVDGDLQIDQSAMTMWIPIADGNRRDGVGDLLDVTGIKTERHYKRPLVLFDHGKTISLPIARAREIPHDPQSYTFKIDAVNKKAGLKAYWYTGREQCDPELGCKQHDHALFCEQLFDMAVKDMIGAGSIGYQVVDAEHLAPDYQRGLPQGLNLKSILMLEGSLVVLPANMDTVGKALTGGRICGKQASPYLVKALQPFAPPRTTQVIGGYEKRLGDIPHYQQSHIPGESCSTCKAYVTHNGSGHCKMYDATVGATMVCDSWTPKEGSKAMQHGPQCKCAKCMEKYSKKDCGCNECKMGHACPCENKSVKSQPSTKVSPEKACTILKDGEANGKPLTDKQRGMFGAACGRKHIRHEDGKWVLYTRDGSRVLGRHGTKEDALAQERAVEAHKHGKALRILKKKYLKKDGEEPPKAPAAPKEPTQTTAPISQRRPAQLGDVSRHPLYGQQPAKAPAAPAPQQRPAQLGNVSDHPLYGQQPTPPAEKPIVEHVGAATPREEVDQFIRAFDRRLASASPAQIQRILKHNYSLIHTRYSPELADHFLREARDLLAARQDTKKPGKSLMGVKSLKDLMQQYRTGKGRSRRLKKSSPGHTVAYVAAKDIDKLRQDAGASGVTVKWMEDDGQGMTKVKMTGDDGVIGKLSTKYGKIRRKSLPMKSKATNPIGTMPDSRERLSLSPETLLGHGTEDQSKPLNVPTLTAKGLEQSPQTKGTNMNKSTKAAPEDMLKPEDGGGPHPEGNPDLGGASLDNYETKGPEGDEPYGAQVVRRLHADAAGLLQEYDEFLTHLEDESTRKLVLKHLEDLAGKIEEIEDHFASHERYKDLPGLEGAEGEEGDEDALGGMEKDIGDAPSDAIEETSELDKETTPDEALEGMKVAEDEEPTKEEKALYFKHVKSLRHRYGQKWIGDEDNEKKAYIEKRLKALTGKKDQGSLAEYKYLQGQLKALGDKKPKSAVATGDQVPGNEAASGSAMNVTPKYPKGMSKDMLEEKAYLQKRWKALSKADDKDEEANKEKSYILMRWKALKTAAAKALPAKDEDDKDDKSLLPRHRKAIGEARTFLKALEDEDEYDDTKRLKAFHLSHKMAEVVKDIYGEDDDRDDEDTAFDKAFQNLAKALITEANDKPHAPSSNSQLKVGHDKMPYDEGKHAIGTKDFAEMKKEANAVNVTAPSSNAWVKPGGDHMPYDEGQHLVGKKDFPEMKREVSEAGVENPSSNPQVAKVGKEPMQQFGDGGSLVKYLKHVADASHFLKSIASRKDFGFADREKAMQLGKALDGGMSTPTPETKSEFPGDRDFWEEEQEEAEHKPGEIGEKALNGLMAASLRQSQLTQDLMSKVAALGVHL